MNTKEAAEAMRQLGAMHSIVLPIGVEVKALPGTMRAHCQYCGTSPEWGKATSCPNCGAPRPADTPLFELSIPDKDFTSIKPPKAKKVWG